MCQSLAYAADPAHLCGYGFQHLLALSLHRNLRGASFLWVWLDLKVLKLCVPLDLVTPLTCCNVLHR